MVRILGVNIKPEKVVFVALQQIRGIGKTLALRVLTALGIDPQTRVNALSDADLVRIAEYINTHHIVEGDLLREIHSHIKRLTDIGCYRGQRHRRNLPVRGQRTHTNARTRKGRAKPIAGKKVAGKK